VYGFLAAVVLLKRAVPLCRRGTSMEEKGGRSDVPQITAVYTQGKLLLAATGVATADRVIFEPEALFERAPVFVLKEDASARAEDATPFRVAMPFAVRSPPEEVLVRYGTAVVRVPVLVASDPRALERRETTSLVKMATAGRSGGRTRIPRAFEEMLADDGEDVQTPLLWPLRMEALFEGHIELAPADPRRAIGYSATFDFGEAFRNALRALPPESADDRDRLTVVHVTDTGALIGGDGGVNCLFVAILAY